MVFPGLSCRPCFPPCNWWFWRVLHKVWLQIPEILCFFYNYITVAFTHLHCACDLMWTWHPRVKDMDNSWYKEETYMKQNHRHSTILHFINHFQWSRHVLFWSASILLSTSPNYWWLGRDLPKKEEERNISSLAFCV